MSNYELIELEPIECDAYQMKEVLKILLHSIIFQRALGTSRLCDAESDLLDVSYVRCDSRAICQRVEEYAEGFSSALERSAAQLAAAQAQQAAAGGSSSSSSGGAAAAGSSGVAPCTPRRLPARICVAFVERRSRPRTFGLFGGEDKVTWERWHITLSVRTPEPAASSSELGSVGNALSASLGPGGAAVVASGAGGSSARDDAAARRRLQQDALADELRARLELILSTAATRKEHLPPADNLSGDSTNWFEVTSDSESWSGLGDLFKLGFGRGSFKAF